MSPATLRYFFKETDWRKMKYMSTLLNPFGCFFYQVFEGYGQTETTAAATLQMIGDQTYGEKRSKIEINSSSSWWAVV